jgi:formamidopyrimidine-DNA glycosylase
VPELPETETIARDLDAALRGAQIGAATVLRPDVLRGERDPAAFSARAARSTVTRVWRRAKLVVLELSNELRLAVQPRFTGALLLHNSVYSGDDFTCIVWPLDDGRTLTYRDVRRLGTVALFDQAQWNDYERALGVEPLGEVFTAECLSGILRSSRQAVKAVLMDQRRIAGIGNIYATEALWRAGIDPSRAADRVAASPDAVLALHSVVQNVLRESIALRGTTFRDYQDAYGGKGGFAARLSAYGRAGEPCPRCGRRLIGTDAIDGRMTVFCAGCQS